MRSLPGRTRGVAALLLVAVALTLTPAASPAASTSKLAAYRGLGAWVDIYDGPAWDDPEGTVLKMTQKGVRTLYLQTCNWRCRNAIFKPHKMRRFIMAAHALGMRVVGWYLPGYDKMARDRKRSLKAINFETVTGDRFDSFALDIEARIVTPESKRNQRILTLAQQIRDAVGPSYPLGAITPPWYWDWNFPYAGLAQHVDVFLPMAYTSFRASGVKATRGDLLNFIGAVRSGTGIHNVPIHLIGGIGDGLSRKETGAVVRVAREHGLLGVSLYDFMTSTSKDWKELAKAPNNPRQSPALPVAAGNPVAMGNIPGRDTSHKKEVFYGSGGRTGAWRVRAEVFDAQPGEVSLWVNWKKVADVAPTGLTRWQHRTITVPSSLWKANAPNYISFRAAGELPYASRWGVRGMKLLEP